MITPVGVRSEGLGVAEPTALERKPSISISFERTSIRSFTLSCPIGRKQVNGLSHLLASAVRDCGRQTRQRLKEFSPTYFTLLNHWSVFRKKGKHLSKKKLRASHAKQNTDTGMLFEHTDLIQRRR